MYFPYLRGRQFELIALRELVENSLLSPKVIPIIEPVKLSSTLITTLKSFEEKQQRVAFIFNPQVGEYSLTIKKGKNVSLKDKVLEAIKSPFVIKAHILNAHSEEELDCLFSQGVNPEEILMICQNKDFIPIYEQIFKKVIPQYNLIPDESVFRRRLKHNRVLLANRFPKKERNSAYADNIDEPFSDDHLYYKEDGYIGFSDFSVIGDEYIEAGFAPYAVAIHIVYFDEEKGLRIRHFVSDTNDDISDPAGKFSEAVYKLVKWNEDKKIQTDGIRTLENLYKNEIYPGLGTVKKLSVMHHLELMSQYLDGVSSE